MIEYRKGDLFSAERTVRTWFGHSCNAQGVWGAGVARAFRERYPREFLFYQEFCQRHTDSRDAVGRGLLAGRVACLITSNDYGPRLDAPHDIVAATSTALQEVMRAIGSGELHIPKINAGLFRVPWEMTTEAIHNAASLHSDVTVVVWEL